MSTSFSSVFRMINALQAKYLLPKFVKKRVHRLLVDSISNVKYKSLKPKSKEKAR